ncbi:hypothetical protein ABID92_002864 [Frigoribacterium sp. PvP120]|jgi:hypothetical protein|uniref:DUF4333 domain-containing protein n=1 Tax=unclassified Frigoribacterium TaxID=2627005 RepID=UPI001AE3026E|nr:DUF4333 domain-containing protein [Frigoribacterium sp. PvP121]MBP1240051.1 hypothetical protein [Frigoribacterium sp. PvP121]
MRASIAASSLLTAVVLTGALAGCTASASANRTVSADKFATSVADALEEQVGTRPDVDCGDDAIDVVDGEEVHCDVNTPGYDVVYDSVSVVNTDDGENYTVSVTVDSEPKS